VDVTIREATAIDAPFLAWVMQTAARSHRPLGLWDLAIPGPDRPRLETIAQIAVTEPPCFTHYGGFLVAEADGQPVAGLSAYDSAIKSMDGFTAAMNATLEGLGWSAEHRALAATRLAPMNTCMPDSPPGVWVIEWVAAVVEARGRGVAHALLIEILERGRIAGYTKSQIGYLLGNTPAQSAYERVGFKTVDEKRHADFEAVFGSPGIARMVRDL
jgi:GNAT superfamily N-acetyltransferase